MAFKVKALRKGYYALRRIREGAEFKIEKVEDFGSWMEPVEPVAPELAKYVEAYQAKREAKMAQVLASKKDKDPVELEKLVKDLAAQVAALEAELKAAKASKESDKGKPSSKGKDEK